jgi:hypothetical protein
MEKKFGKEEKVSKNIPVGFFTKINSSEQWTEYMQQSTLCCCASQNKTRKIKTNSIGMFYKYLNSFII